MWRARLSVQAPNESKLFDMTSVGTVQKIRATWTVALKAVQKCVLGEYILLFISLFL